MATHEVPSAPALARVQRDIDRWAVAIERGAKKAAREHPEYWPAPGEPVIFLGCDVYRNDGRLLSLHCHGHDMAPRPSVHEKVFHYLRDGDTWRPLDGKALLPEGGHDPHEALGPWCGNQLLRPSDYDGVPDMMLPGVRRLYVKPMGGRLHWGQCWVPLAELGAVTGCGPLGYLARPGARQPPESGRGAPLRVVLQDDERRDDGFKLVFGATFPRLSSHDAGGRTAAEALDAEIASWVQKQEKIVLASPPDDRDAVRCDVTMSTSALISVLCRRGGYGASASAAASFTRRLDDEGSTVTVDELFAARPAAVAKIAAHCAARSRDKRAVPVWTKQDLSAFGLAQRGVVFSVRFEADEPSNHPPSREDCEVPWPMLGTNPGALAR